MATQYASASCKLTISSHLFARWQFWSGITIYSYLFARCHLHVGYWRHQQQVDLWPFDLESGVRVTCDVGYLCDNFSLPKPLCSRVRPDVRDRQTDVRQTSDNVRHRLMPPPYEDGGIIITVPTFPSIATSAKEVMLSLAFVCLSAVLCTNYSTDFTKCGERWHIGHRRNQQILVVLRITLH